MLDKTGIIKRLTRADAKASQEIALWKERLTLCEKPDGNCPNPDGQKSGVLPDSGGQQSGELPDSGGQHSGVLPDEAAFAGSLYRYVLYKFLLDDEEDLPDTHELNRLAMLSVEKAGRLNPNEAALLDVSKHCGATSSWMTKKVLLFMGLSRLFEFDYPPYNTADIETTDELAAIILEKTAGKRAGQKGQLCSKND